ncbi:MAG: hypothetical protein MIO92_07960 [Methanosarcinaceae archaeon]|nr:hypothetical protein [Methanosarcinaceae archaeon]
MGKQITKQDIEHRFTYHKPGTVQALIYMEVRDKAKELAHLLNVMLPDSREKSLAFTKLEECVFWANASVARELSPDMDNEIVKDE